MDSVGSIVQIHISNGGLPKLPIREGRVGPLGLEGDRHNHPKFHGGPTRALLMVCSEVVDTLIGRGYPVFPGALGENVTVRGIDHRGMRAGQRYRLGEVVIELTTVREPCSALNIYGASIRGEIYDKLVRSGSPESPRWAMSGFYTSVLRGGVIWAGAPVTPLDESA